MEVIGSTVEGAIPIWGQARAAADTVGGALANPIEGRPPELDSAISLTEMFKDGVTGNLGKGASFNGKTLHINVRLPNGKRVTATARMPKVGPETAVEAPRVSTSNTPTKATTASGRGNSLATRLKKIQTEGLGGKGGPQVAKKWGVEDAQKKSAYGGTPPRQSANGQTGATTAPQTQVKWKNFRVNRGGDALATTALAYKKFDQANFSVFRKRNPDGVCQGLSLEAIQRIDRGLAQGQDLSTTVLDIKKGLLKSSPDQKTLVTSISSKQQNPKLAAVRKLEPQPTRRYQGDRQTSINALENDLRSMAQNDVAVLRMKIKGKHGETLETGHMLVVQRTKDQQYQLFDSNNGVFTYANEDALRNGLDPYFDAAYSERGVMSPDSFTLYKSQPAAATVTPKAPESPDPQRPYGEHHDFPYIDADNVPERKTATVPTQTDSPGTRPAPSPVGGNTDLDIRLNVDNVNRELPGLTAQGRQNAARYLSDGTNPVPVLHNPQDIDSATRFFNEGGKSGLLGGAPGGDGPSQPKRTKPDPDDGQQASTSTERDSVYGGVTLSDSLKSRMLDTIRKNLRRSDDTIARQFGVPTAAVTELRARYDLRRTSGRYDGISQETRDEISNYIRTHDDESDLRIAKRFDISKALALTIRQELGIVRARNLSDERRAQIVSYLRNNINDSDDTIGKMFDVSGPTVNKLRHENGLQKARGSGVSLSAERKIEIRDYMLKHRNLRNRDIAARFEISNATVSRIRNDPAYVTSPAQAPSPLPEGLDLDAPLSLDSQRRVDDFKGDLARTLPGDQPGNAGGSSALSQGLDADAPLSESRQRNLQLVWDELAWVNPDEPTNPQMMRWMAKNLSPQELQRLANLPDPQVESEVGFLRRRADLPEEGIAPAPAAKPTAGPSGISSGSSARGNADVAPSPDREQQREQLQKELTSSPKPPADADQVINWLLANRSPQEVDRILNLSQDEFDAEIARARQQMLEAAHSDVAPGPSGAGGGASLNIRLDTSNVFRELPGLTPAGRQNAMRYLAPGAGNPVPVLRSPQDIENATKFFNEGRTGLRGGADGGGSSGQSQPSASETNGAATAPMHSASGPASTGPDMQAITPSAGSLNERDLQIKKEVEQNHIADPQSPDYAAHIEDVVARASDQTGVVKEDLPVLQKMAYKYNTIISIRPVDKYATGLIEEGYETKGFHIKGKSASWGPQAGLICADQKFSKLENADSARIDKFNQEIKKSIDNKDATKIPLELSWTRLQKLSDMGTIANISEPDLQGVRSFTATAPSGKQYHFEATPMKDGQYVITSEHKPLEVLSPTPPGSKPFTADYDLFAVAPHIADVGPQDRVPTPDVHHDVYRKRVDGYENKDGINPNLKPAYDDKTVFHKNDDPDIGNSTQRVANLIPVINDEIKANDSRARADVAHHADDSTNPVTDQDANFPATFFLPYTMGRFDEIAVIHDKSELKDLIQAAKDRGYNFPLNPLWDGDITGTRRTGFTQAQQKVSGSNTR